MELIDKKQFNSQLKFVAIKIAANHVTNVLHLLKDHIFSKPKLRKVYPTTEPSDYRYILLHEDIQDLDLTTLPNEIKAKISELGGTTEYYNIPLDYSYYNVEEVLRQLLPPDIEIPSSFEQIGHIAHLNLKQEALPYKYIIGQVILDKNTLIRTVVNKLGSIESVYRTFPMEILAGEEDYHVKLRESNAVFSFNFAEVYWNSRLQMEHNRLIELIHQRIQSIDHSKPFIIVDMMAGVGPFAVPLAMNCGSQRSKSQFKDSTHSVIKKRSLSKPNASIEVSTGGVCRVYANDLNPASYKYLVENIALNNCQSTCIPYNLDGREFIVHLIKSGIIFDEVIMNLPHNAIDFLDVFVGLWNRYQRASSSVGGSEPNTQPFHLLPRINVYGFSSADDPIDDMIQRSAAVLRCNPSILMGTEMNSSSTTSDKGKCTGHIVRDVSPRKMMVCLSFFLPQEVAENSPIDDHNFQDLYNHNLNENLIQNNMEENEKKQKLEEK